MKGAGYPGWRVALAGLALLGACRCEGSRATPDAGGPPTPQTSAPAPPRFTSTYKMQEPYGDLLASRTRLLALPAVSVTEEGARYDLGVLHRVVTEGYVGADDVIGGRGAWDDAFARMDAQLKNPEVRRQPRLLELWRDGLAEVAPASGIQLEARFEQETRAVRVGAPPALRMAMLEVLPRGDGRWGLDPGSAPSADLLDAEVTRCLDSPALPEALQVWSPELERPVWRFAWPADAVADRTVAECEVRLPGNQRRLLAAPLAALSGSAAAERLDGVRLLEGPGGVRVLRVATLDADAARGAARLEGLLREVQGAPLIVDLRGCTGAEGLGQRLGATLAGVASLEVPLRRLTSAVTRQGDVNRALDAVVRFEATAPLEPPARDLALESRLQEALGAARVGHRDGIGLPAEPSVTPSSITITSLDAPAPARVVLLIDRGCAGGCEALVAAARAASPGHIEVIGAPTAGAMDQGDPGLYILPRSGVRVTLPTLRLDLPASPLARAAQPPDLWLPGDAAPWEVAAKRVASPGP